MEWFILKILWRWGLYRPIIRDIETFYVGNGSIQAYNDQFENGSLVWIYCVSGRYRAYELKNVYHYRDFGTGCISADIKETPFITKDIL